jgi:hypothetical protein
MIDLVCTSFDKKESALTENFFFLKIQGIVKRSVTIWKLRKTIYRMTRPIQCVFNHGGKLQVPFSFLTESDLKKKKKESLLSEKFEINV